MAKFLTTVDNSSGIEGIIRKAKEKLMLVTPYLKLNRTLTERIMDADKRGIKITVIYGKNQLPKQEHDLLWGLKNIQIYFFEHLHAKCYHNDEKMIISSMNLYDFSERNNREMGIAIERGIDDEIFNEAKEEIESIINNSKLEKAFIEEKPILEPISAIKHEVEIGVATKVGKERFGASENTFFPELGKRLKERYPDSLINGDTTKLTINNFLQPVTTLIIDGRIEFKWKNHMQYEIFKRRNRNLTIEEYPGVRIYWNNNLCIYNEKDFVTPTGAKGDAMMIEKYLRIIEVVGKRLKF
jgi:hypothetical protein